MKRAVVFALVFGCALPSVDKIDLAGCTHQCNEASKVCFDIANRDAENCLSWDASQSEKTVCVQYQTKAGEKCVNDLVECVSVCIEETQRQLGGK